MIKLLLWSLLFFFVSLLSMSTILAEGEDSCQMEVQRTTGGLPAAIRCTGSCSDDIVVCPRCSVELTIDDPSCLMISYNNGTHDCLSCRCRKVVQCPNCGYDYSYDHNNSELGECNGKAQKPTGSFFHDYRVVCSGTCPGDPTCTDAYPEKTDPYGNKYLEDLPVAPLWGAWCVCE